MSRPTEIKHGAYTAVIFRDGEEGKWGKEYTWIIVRDGVAVGKMFQGGMYSKPNCTMRELVWSGPFPADASDPKSPNYGMCFDVGPCATHEEALATFAKRADRLIEWRKANA